MKGQNIFTNSESQKTINLIPGVFRMRAKRIILPSAGGKRDANSPTATRQ